MKRTILILAIASLTGCTFCREHQTACTAAAMVAFGSVAIAITKSHGSSSTGTDNTISIPTLPDCAKNPEQCK